jgi:sortase A
MQSPVPGTVPVEGQPVGIIQIPKIAVDKVVVEGTATADLRLGPGHYPGTPLPGQPGNAAIAGHRTTYGAPFYNLNELVPGDQIVVTTTQGRFCYDVTQVLVVKPSDVAVVAPTSTPELTLTTCNPRFSAAQRLVVQASLLTPPAVIPDHVPLVRPPRSSSSGLGGEQGSWTGAFGWGAACLAVAIGVWALARRRRRPWATYTLGAVPLLLVLFLFFENLSPLLPASF